MADKEEWNVTDLNNLAYYWCNEPVLYNLKLKEHHDRDLKKLALQRVASKIGKPGKVLKFTSSAFLVLTF